MNLDDNKNLEIFVLGAGCSRASGYPLAAELKEGLRSFAAKIADSSPIVSGWCLETVKLLDEYYISTLDELANRLLSGALRSDKKDESEYWKMAQKAVDRAKAAVSAYFLDLENEELDISAYKQFIDEHIPETGSEARVPTDSPLRVLSFNYDRLFEIAFAQRFQDRRATDDQMLHGLEWMNCGIAFGEQNPVINRDRFSLLKLHGSVGHTIRGLFPESRHEIEFAARGFGRMAPEANWDSDFVKPVPHGNTLDAAPYESTICFPIEKAKLIQSVEQNPLRAYDKRAYIATVWEAADDFMSRAKHVTICGFSGRGKDSAYLKRLIEKARAVESVRIYDPIADEVAERIIRFRPDLESKIRARRFLFWLRSEIS